MTYAFDKGKEEIIKKVIAVIHEKLPEAKATLLSKFVGKFFGTVAKDDLKMHSIMDLYGAVLSFWDFMYQRNPNQTKIRVYNPEYESNAWQSTHTIIEIITDDMPFIVDSVVMEVNRRELACHLVMHLGGLRICRGDDNEIVDVYTHGESGGKTCLQEAPIYLEIDRQTDPAVLKSIQEDIERVLDDVRVSVEDWSKMRDKVSEATEELTKHQAILDQEELAESIDFLQWIKEDHFTFMGMRDYELVTEGNEKVLKLIPETGLGVLRDSSNSAVYRKLASMTPEARNLTLSSQILIISKTNTLSTVHRPTYTDYIGIKRFDDSGQVIGERRIIGLYTSAAYKNPSDIPFLRRKVANIIEKSGMQPSSHAGKALLNILETLPRDDLFQANEDDLLEMSMGIFHLQERRRIRLFALKDSYGRYISCLVYVPRERFNTDLRLAIQKILVDEFNGTESSFFTRFSDSVLARIHFVIRIDPSKPLEYDLKEIEKKVIEVGRVWEDELADCIVDGFGEEKSNALIQRYSNAFPAGYREYYQPRTALYDIRHIENLSADKLLELNFYKPIDDLTCDMRFKVYQYESTIPLSDVLPILENMGLRVISERPNLILPSDGKSVWINDFGMSAKSDANIAIEGVKEKFQEAFRKIWFRKIENDGFNQLVILAGLDWKELTILRAYAKYFRQTGFTFSQAYIERTLSSHPHIARKLVELFHLRFDPEAAAENVEKIEAITQAIKTDLDAVVSLDDDRIMRRYLDVIHATLRTNYFQVTKTDKSKTYLSFKLDPSAIPELPLPRPMFEVFVYSPRVEGVHLRGAKVARGGLRWSDRREDFRTEVLGLMKAQQVKNAVIVPLGAKGGFVPKKLPTDGDREAILAEGVACYKIFIRALLDITDNNVAGEVVPPKNVYRYDEDDPYLVVAADKGTATFSDIANTISKDYGFWLGDAFASGGSVGYDHKKMGITARGAWESVKRHFREIGKDIQNEDFTCVGVGDMAGDVFGNGMLLSKHIKLVAAFNHMHIFIDPNPDVAASFKERQRLFELPRSAWTDYDTKVISQGGGVFNRSAKSVELTPEIMKLLGIKQKSMTPNELIRSILRAPVDLLWNGGIGTYVRAEHETDAEVGDRANDSLRVTPSQLHCKVVGEGGNLGLTQRARVEYALLGGHVYSDFVDNSAGVNCSDKEVNIKILLNDVVMNGDMTEKQRNELLASMTDEVADLVLADNYNQTLAISLAAEQAAKHVELHIRYIEDFEKMGRLDRSLEFLPDEQTLFERKLAGKGLTRPGLAVLFAYSKTLLKEQILDSDVPEDEFLCNVLESAFPLPLRDKYRNEMREHSLRREIIATVLSNQLINEMGFTFAYRLYDETGATPANIVRAYAVIRDVFNLGEIWQAINALDNVVPSELQFEMIMKFSRLARRGTRWFLKNRRMHFDIADSIREFKDKVKQLATIVPSALGGDDLEYYNTVMKNYAEKKVPDELVTELALIGPLLSALNIIDAANENNLSLEEVSSVYFSINESLELGWIRRSIIAHPIESQWEALTREALRDDLDWQQRLLTIAILKHKTKSQDIDKRIDSWIKKYNMLIERWQYMVNGLRSSSSLKFTMFFVAIRELLDLTQTSLQTTNNHEKKPLKMANKSKSGSTKPNTPASKAKKLPKEAS